MNHLVLLTASPRAHGNSSILADAFIDGASEEGVKVTRYDLARLHVHPCLACDQCPEKHVYKTMILMRLRNPF